MQEFADLTVIVTGGASGIGAILAVDGGMDGIQVA